MDVSGGSAIDKPEKRAPKSPGINTATHTPLVIQKATAVPRPVWAAGARQTPWQEDCPASCVRAGEG
jgi:hypothetical protein